MKKDKSIEFNHIYSNINLILYLRIKSNYKIQLFKRWIHKFEILPLLIFKTKVKNVIFLSIYAKHLSFYIVVALNIFFKFP